MGVSGNNSKGKTGSPAKTSSASPSSTIHTGGGNNNKRYVGSLSLITFAVLVIAWLTGFLSRLFSVIRFESIIHEFDPW